MYQIISEYLNGEGGYEIKVVTGTGVQNPPHVKLSILFLQRWMFYKGHVFFKKRILPEKTGERMFAYTLYNICIKE